MENLSRRNGVWYFRAVVPRDLQHYFPQRELRKSLRTKSLRNAKVALRPLQAKTETLFGVLRTAMLPPEFADMLVRKYFNRVLNSLELSDAQDFRRMLPEDRRVKLRSKRGTFEALRDYTSDCLAVADYEPVEEAVAEQVVCSVEHEFFEMDRDGQEYLMLCHRFLEAQHDVFAARASHLSGDRARADQLLEKYRIAAPTPTPAPAPSQEPPGKLLSTVADEWVSKAKLDGLDPAHIDKSAKEFRILIRWLGDKPVSSYTSTDIDAFRELLRKLPSSANRKNSPLRGKSGDELHKLSAALPEKRYKLLAVDAKEDSIRKLFLFAVERRYIPYSPFPKLKKQAALMVEKAKESARDSMSQEQLQLLFNSPRYTTGRYKEMRIKPLDYWAPLITLMCGLRPPNEIAQLQVAHVIEVDGMTCLLSTDTGDGKSKTKSHHDRVTPIHPDLIRMGFMDYVESRRAEGATMLWAQARKTPNGWGVAAGARLNRYIRKHVSKDPKIVLYSVRHSFSDALENAGYFGGEDKLLMGHVGANERALAGSSGTGAMKSYAGRDAVPVRVKLELLEKLDYGVDLSHLMEPPVKPSAKKRKARKK